MIYLLTPNINIYPALPGTLCAPTILTMLLLITQLIFFGSGREISSNWNWWQTVDWTGNEVRTGFIVSVSPCRVVSLRRQSRRMLMMVMLTNDDDRCARVLSQLHTGWSCWSCRDSDRIWFSATCHWPGLWLLVSWWLPSRNLYNFKVKCHNYQATALHYTWWPDERRLQSCLPHPPTSHHHCSCCYRFWLFAGESQSVTAEVMLPEADGLFDADILCVCVFLNFDH